MPDQPVNAPSELLDPRDYEVCHGGGRITIKTGHPCYCAKELAGQPHDPHRHDYVYRDKRGERVRGYYQCPGVSHGEQ